MIIEIKNDNINNFDKDIYKNIRFSINDKFRKNF